MKLFIVDDDETARIALRDILGKTTGLILIQASNGIEALNLLNAGLRPDLCLFDIRMPQISGLQLVQAIRTDAALRDLKIAMTTSSRDREEIVALAALGICGYLLKPYAPERVLALVDATKATLPRKIGATA